MQPNQSLPDVLSPIEDKLSFLRECIHELEQEIRHREQQKQDFLNELLQKTCDVQNDISATGDHVQRRTTLELEIKNLEKEMRHQKLDCWRDTTALKRELRQLKKECRAVGGALCSARKK